jgi:hypothetical protein
MKAGANAASLETGNEDELFRVATTVDRFQPARNVTVPSLDDMTHMDML